MAWNHKKSIFATMISSALWIGSASVYANPIHENTKYNEDQNLAEKSEKNQEIFPKTFLHKNNQENKYLGISVGYSKFISRNGKIENFVENHIPVGIFAGLKLNNFLKIEVRAERIGAFQNYNNDRDKTFRNSATFYNGSIDGIVSVPISSNSTNNSYLEMFNYSNFNIYAKAGYGINFSNYSFPVSSGTNPKSVKQAGFNAGAGINIDWNDGISTRIGYTYYQIPETGNMQAHGNMHVISADIYYNIV